MPLKLFVVGWRKPRKEIGESVSGYVIGELSDEIVNGLRKHGDLAIEYVRKGVVAVFTVQIEYPAA